MSILKESVKAAAGDENFRENLGNEVSLHVQKMIMASIFEMGTGGQAFLYHSGYKLGTQLVDQNICVGNNLEEVLKSIASIADQFKLGIISIVEVTGDTATVDSHECHFCSGFPNIGEVVCYYESGMIAGILDRALKSKFTVTETKCYGTGFKVCEYEIKRTAKRGTDEYVEIIPLTEDSGK